jgi:ketol-acid reductoisomerase
MKVYYDRDVKTDVLDGKTIAVIGYGIQGSAQALCMKDSGFNVIVGARKGGSSWKAARKDGMTVFEIEEAARRGDIVCMLTPDMTHREVYEKHVRRHMKKGKTLYFSHGLSIVYGLVKPPKDVDVIMVAPKGPGKKLREAYKRGRGLPAIFAINQDASGSAKETALALSKAIGLTRAGVFEATFEQETFCDLFGEQAVLCGGTTELVKAGFETLVEDGFPPEMAYFEVLYELKLIVDLIEEGGLEYMWERISETARHGGRTKGTIVVDEKTKKRMKKILREIKNGKFAREWLAEYEEGMPTLKRMKKVESRHEIERIGKEIRRKFNLAI